MKPSCKIQVPDVIEKFEAYYKKPGNGAWGSLHVVLDDQNVSDYFVEFCEEECVKRNDTDGLELVNILKQLSKTQRIKISKLIS